MVVQLVVVGLLVAICAATDLNYPKNNPCILIKVESNNSLSWTPAKGSAITVPVNFTEAKVINGSCNNTGPFLELFWESDNGTMRFDFKNTSGKVDLDMTVSFVPELTFKDKNNTGNSTLSITIPMKAGSVDRAFRCFTEQTMFLNKQYDGDNYTLTLRFKDLMMQGFGVENSSFSNYDECAADTTTTEATTTEATTTEATTTKATTTKATTTTPKPTVVPTKVTLKATDGNITCAMLVGKMTLLIPYNTTKTGVKTATVVVPKNVTSKGNCSVGANTMSAMFDDGWVMDFQFGGDSDNIWWDKLAVKVLYNVINFPDIDPNKVGTNATFTTSFDKRFKAKKKGSYLCNSNTITNLKSGLQLKTTDLQYTALQQNVSSFSDDNVAECADDAKTSSIVPIAVGAALAGLVVIVLIAYLIGRRRNKKGYESV